jgi:UDP-3-O-[3-hydroxymyristoyl] glucosamine N-acyltransferase
MIQIDLHDIRPFLDDDALIKGNQNFVVSNVQTAEKINSDSLDWLSPLKKDKIQYLINSKAKVIICEIGILIDDVDLTDKCIIQVKNPKLTFIRIVSHFFQSNKLNGIHPSAIIDPSAKIHESTYIGPNTIIGKCVIGENNIIHGNCTLYDNTQLGNNITVHSGTVIGAEGFGYQRNERGEFEKFPHIGGVIIGDHVDIGSNTSIDRGALGNTIIGEGAKIDNLVHIAHNVRVGKHSAIIAHAMIGGSTVIGDYSWVAPNVALRDQINIGNQVTVGMGAVVTKNIPEGETWTGSPAKKLQDFLELQKKLKEI